MYAIHSLAIRVLYISLFCTELNSQISNAGDMEDKAMLSKNINSVATVVRLHGEELAWGQIIGFPTNG